MPSDPVKTTAKRVALRVVPPYRRLVERNATLKKRLEAARTRAEALVVENERLGRALAGRERVAGGGTEDLGYLLIVTYGRSGSTLLQGVLNSIPGYLIRGENRAALHHLFKYHDVLVKEKALQVRDTVLGPHKSWYGLDEYPEELSVTLLRNVVLGALLRPEADTRVVGFKEIRWWTEDWETYFDFLEELLPGLRVVINTRNHDDVSKSKWWAKAEDPYAMLERYEKRLDDIEVRFGDRAYRLHYDDWTADPGVLEGLYAWLGEPFDREAVDEVMAVKHSH